MNIPFVPSTDSIAYSDGFKYQLRQDAQFFVGSVGQRRDIEEGWIFLGEDGWLSVKHGYAWDGSSGPTFDTRNTMRASLLHDAIYELIRKEQLPADSKERADELYYSYLVADGVWKIRARWHYTAVRLFGHKSTLPSRKREVLFAP